MFKYHKVRGIYIAVNILLLLKHLCILVHNGCFNYNGKYVNGRLRKECVFRDHQYYLSHYEGGLQSLKQCSLIYVLNWSSNGEIGLLDPRHPCSSEVLNVKRSVHDPIIIHQSEISQPVIMLWGGEIQDLFSVNTCKFKW